MLFHMRFPHHVIVYLQIIRKYFYFCIESNNCFAPIFAVSLIPTAVSNKSGLPISPTNIKSPVNIPIGLSFV